jgi:hypothetical protein
VPIDTDWITIVKDYPWVFIGLGVLIVTLIYGGRWVMRNKLPEPDWSWTFDADAHPEADPIHTPTSDDRARLSRLFDRDLLEKIVLLSLVCVIFGKILPEVDATDVQVVIGVSTLIILNTAVSEWLARRGRTYQSTIEQFAATVAINFGLVLLAYLLLDRGDGSINEGATLFFVLLISVMVTLFDRYRPRYLARFSSP